MYYWRILSKNDMDHTVVLNSVNMHPDGLVPLLDQILKITFVQILPQLVVLAKYFFFRKKNFNAKYYFTRF